MGRYSVPVGRYPSDVRCSNCGEMMEKMSIGSLIHCACLDQGLTQTYLHQVMAYDAETGLFTYNLSIGRGKLGEVAGRQHPTGYVRIAIRRKDYLAHRLAWFYTYGRMPEFEIDHINGNRIDNRLCNLREATHAQNTHNLSAHMGSKSGIPGVRFRRGKWQARICSDGKVHYLGSYATPELATAAHREAKERFHSFSPIQRPAGVEGYRFQNVFCSQCGSDLGPGNEGVSHCGDHR